MRPPSIVTFERVVLFSIVLGIVNAFFTWDRIDAQVSETGVGGGTLIGIQAVTIALYLLLIWFISRHGSSVAKWIYVVLAGLGLVVGLAGIGETLALGAISAVMTAVQYILTIASIWLLFRPDAKAWFAEGRGGPDAETL